MCRPENSTSFGGKGVTVTEVLQFLRSTKPKINYLRTNLSFGTNFTANSTTLNKLKERDAMWKSEKTVAEVIATTPLVNGQALGVAFLGKVESTVKLSFASVISFKECLITTGEAPPNLHDEFAQLLIEGLKFEGDFPDGELSINSNDSEDILMYKTYRKKLQYFLAQSSDYHANRVIKFLPGNFHLENALVLAKLGKHRDVLKIYLNQIQDEELAEKYCELLHFTLSGRTGEIDNTSSNYVLPSFRNVPGIDTPGEIYLILFEVRLFSLWNHLLIIFIGHA